MGHLKKFEAHNSSSTKESRDKVKNTFDNKVNQIVKDIKNLSIDLDDLPKIIEAKFGDSGGEIYNSRTSDVKDMNKLATDIESIKTKMNKLIEDLKKL